MADADRSLGSLWAELAWIVVTERPVAIVLGVVAVVSLVRYEGLILFAMMAALVVWYWLLLPVEARWSGPRRMARHWRGSLGQHGAAHDLGLRNKSGKVPALSSRGEHDTGRVFGLTLPDGITPQDVRDRVSALAGHFGSLSVEVRTESPRRVEIRTYDSDPLVGVRESMGPCRGDLAPIVVGRCQDGSDAVIDLRDPSHIAVQGMTRSGKSAFLYTALSPLVGAVRAGHVRLAGLDPNRVLLAPWQHVTGTDDLALGSDPERAATVLDGMVSDLDARLDLLDMLGLEALIEFTETSPLLLVVLEEYPATLAAAEAHDQGVKPPEKTAPRIKRAVARLVSEGAKAGIRVVLIAQRMDASVVGGRERSQFGTRVTFAVDNRDAVAMLHPEVEPETVEAVRSFPPGRALLWQHRVETFMQGDLTEYATYRRRLGASVRTEEV